MCQRRCVFSRLYFDYPAEVSTGLTCELQAQGDRSSLYPPFPCPGLLGQRYATLSMAAASVSEGSSLGARAGDCDHHPSLPNFNDQLNSLDTETSDYYSDNDDFDQDFPRFNKFDSIDFDY